MTTNVLLRSIFLKYLLISAILRSYKIRDHDITMLLTEITINDSWAFVFQSANSLSSVQHLLGQLAFITNLLFIICLFKIIISSHEMMDFNVLIQTNKLLLCRLTLISSLFDTRSSEILYLHCSLCVARVRQHCKSSYSVSVK